jgi:tight adherence protein B
MLGGSMMTIVGLLFLGILTLIIGAYWLIVIVPEGRGKSVVRRRLKWQDPVQAGVDLLKKQDVLSNIDLLDSVLKRFGGFSASLKITLDQAAVPLTVGSFLLLSAALSLTVMVVAQMYSGFWYVGVIAGAGVAFAPLFVVKQLRARKILQFEEQFPEAIQLVARAMRAGHAFATGLKMAAEEMPPPCGTEFRILHDQQNFGAQMADALKAFAARVPSLDARFFVTAVLTQRETGGNLAEILDRLSAVMRERFRIKREVRVKSAHGRMTAYVLAGMPPALAGMMLFNSPDQLRLLLTDPLGQKMILGALVLQVIGTFVVRKLVDIQY